MEEKRASEGEPVLPERRLEEGRMQVLYLGIGGTGWPGKKKSRLDIGG